MRLFRRNGDECPKNSVLEMICNLDTKNYILLVGGWISGHLGRGVPKYRCKTAKGADPCLDVV